MSYDGVTAVELPQSTYRRYVMGFNAITAQRKYEQRMAARPPSQPMPRT